MSVIFRRIGSATPQRPHSPYKTKTAMPLMPCHVTTHFSAKITTTKNTSCPSHPGIPKHSFCIYYTTTQPVAHQIVPYRAPTAIWYACSASNCSVVPDSRSCPTAAREPRENTRPRGSPRDRSLAPAPRAPATSHHHGKGFGSPIYDKRMYIRSV